MRSEPDPDTCSGTRLCNAAGVCSSALGTSCVDAAECVSGHCVDGVCCDTACAGNCEACASELKEEGPSGTCGPAKKGLNPRDECSCETPEDCPVNFTCDAVRRTCIPQSAASCDGDHTLTAPDRTTTDCSPYKCEGSTCKTTCASVLDCVYPNECSRLTQTCQPPLERVNAGEGCSCRSAGSGEGVHGGAWMSLAGIVAALGRRRVRRGQALRGSR